MAIKFVIRRHSDAPDAPPLAETAFHGPMATIGRGEAATIRLDDQAIALEQAVVINEEGKLILINQAEGTFLNDGRLSREAIHTLKGGDRLRIGAYLIELLFDEPLESAREGDSTNSTPEDLSAPAKPPATAPPQSSAPTVEESPRRSFAAILDSLRTEEDSFHFMIEGGAQSRRRVPINSVEMIIGWDETGQNISCEAATLVAPRAVVRKDWSGVVVKAQNVGAVSVNDEAVETVRRLRNGDRITLFPTVDTPEQDPQYMIFHEPASLVALNSLLPQKLPPPVPVRAEPEEPTPNPPDPPLTLPPAPQQSASLFDGQRRYFGYFTLIELMLMACGTLIAAVIIFLILEYS